MENTQEVTEYAGWRMGRETYESLMRAKRSAKPATQAGVAITEGQTRVVKAQPVKEDPTDRLFRILSDDHSAPREVLAVEAYEQLYSAIEGSGDWKGPVPKKIQEQNLAYRAELKAKAEKDERLTEAFCRAFSNDLKGGGSEPAVLDKLYDLLK